MTILVTGSSGHLGEAIMRTLETDGQPAIGIDLLPSPYTRCTGSIADRGFVEASLGNVDAIIHTATLHKPHVATHSMQDFVDTNITGTLNLLEAAVAAGIERFVFTSTTSTFGKALAPPPGEPAAWITEVVRPVPKNIYGVTKAAAEDLVELFCRKRGLKAAVLKTSRFFPEEDDNEATRAAFDDENAKANEFLFRRVDLEDAVNAHLCAVERLPDIGFGRYVISATTPFSQDDLAGLRDDPASVLGRLYPQLNDVYRRRGWRIFDSIDRVYVNDKARRELGWHPAYDFARILDQAAAGEPIGSDLARVIGKKGYHAQQFADGPYPTE